MTSNLVFLEGDAREPALEAAWRELHPSRAREASLACQRRLLASPWARRCWRVAALRDDDGQVVASTFLLDLTYRLDSRRLRLGGIGSLSVREDLGRAGLGRFFLKAVHDRLREEGFDGALLFSSVGPSYYERTGHVPLPLATAVADFRALRGASLNDPVTSTIRPFTEADLPAVRNIYNTATSLQALAVLRDDDYWQHVLLRSQLYVELLSPPPLPASFLVGEREGRIVSYLRADRDLQRGDVIIHEYGLEPGAREDVAAMLLWLLERLGVDAPEIVRGIVPTRFNNLPSRRLVWRQSRSSVMMMKSFGGFEVPADLSQDERLIWATDWF